MLVRHKHSPAAQRNTFFLLTTKLFCGHCGQPMVGDSGTSKNGNTYYYYTCKGHRAHKCSKMRVQQDWIEQLVMDNLLQLIHSNDFINEVADKCMEYQTKEQDNSVLNALEARRKELNKSIKN